MTLFQAALAPLVYIQSEILLPEYSTFRVFNLTECVITPGTTGKKNESKITHEEQKVTL